MTTEASSIIDINGNQGEGGGQILRSSLALSLVTGQPFRIRQIRAGRRKPGLMRQHLTAVQAAAAVSQAKVEGDAIGSTELNFTPGPVQPGDYHFSVGTAGSVTLVLQTLLPALMLGDTPSTLTLEGGTHNPYAPPLDFLRRCFAPVLAQLGPRLDLQLERHGFYPAGGGRFVATITPVKKLKRVELLERDTITSRQCKVLMSRLSKDIAKRELKTLKNKLAWEDNCFQIVPVTDSPGPGNVIIVEIGSSTVCEIVSGFGKAGVAAEKVAQETARRICAYLSSTAPVGEYLADQLMLPMALAGGGRYLAQCISLHASTNAKVIEHFLRIPIRFEKVESNDSTRMCVIG